MSKVPYDFYKDMTMVHVENGYLIFIELTLLGYVLLASILLFMIPEPDIYFLPGNKTYQTVNVIWGNELGLLTKESIDIMYQNEIKIDGSVDKNKLELNRKD